MDLEVGLIQPVLDEHLPQAVFVGRQRRGMVAGAPYLLLQRKDAGQREHDLREVFNGLRYIVKTNAP